MTHSNTDIEKALLLGLANHTNEFLNPGFIPGMSHEDLAKVLERIMKSRLPERIEALITTELQNLMENSKYRSYVPNEDIKQRIKKIKDGK